MSSAVAAATAHARTLQRERRERLFYVIACVVMLVGVAVGFHMFYVHGLNDAGQPVTQQNASLVCVHGGLMTCWMVLFALQCGLVTTGNRRLHMKLGMNCRRALRSHRSHRGHHGSAADPLRGSA